MSVFPTELAIDIICKTLACGASGYVGYRLGRYFVSPISTLDLNLEPEVDLLHVDKISKEMDDDTGIEEIADGDLSAIQAGFLEPCKLVLVVRSDIHLSANDTSLQCSEATLKCYKSLHAKNPKLVSHWERTGQAKIALKGKNEDQLLELEAIAKSLNLCARAVHNPQLIAAAGKEGTSTVLGIGPAPVNLINEVTGKLRLL